MSEENNTISGYLGPDFQQGLLWQIATEPEFAEKIIPLLGVEYFDDPKAKRFFIVLVEYLKENQKPPNLQNKSIQIAIKKYTNHVDPLDEEYLNGVLEKIVLWNERIINKDMLNNGDVIQKEAFVFIKQQEYRKLGEFILDKVKTGDIKSNITVNTIEDKIKKIGQIGDEEDNGIGIIENIDRALRKEFREAIPTGIDAIDDLTGGGLGKGEVGIVLSPSGIGKTTSLTKIANSGVDDGKIVLQIIFEDSEDDVRRKHYAIWSGIALDKINDNTDLVKEKVLNHFKDRNKVGDLIVKKFSDDGTTILDVRRWIDKYQKKFNTKFDLIVLDYLDCLESHKKAIDQNQSELYIIKSFLSMASDYNIPCWSALQTNRTGINMEWVESHMMGGNIKRLQKSHFVMSIAKTAEQKEGGELANIKILKARFAADGHMFRDCIFNNNTLEIRITDPRWDNKEKPSTESSLEILEGKFIETALNIGVVYNPYNMRDELTDIIMKKAPPIEKQYGVDPIAEIDKLTEQDIGKSFETQLAEADNSRKPLVTEENTISPSNNDSWNNIQFGVGDPSKISVVENFESETIPETIPIKEESIIEKGSEVVVEKELVQEPVPQPDIKKSISKKEKIAELHRIGFTAFGIDDDDTLIDGLYNTIGKK